MITFKRNKWFLIVGVLCIGALAGVGVYALIEGQNHKTATVEAASVSKHTPQTTISYTGNKGETALAQLKRVAPNVITKQSSYGEYVDSIDGLASGTDGKYWSFYVNGSLATEGAGAYIANGGEKIEWKFEKLQ